ncbi:SMF family protein [Dehalogenimonas lykanthroporepellens BL-DC-9]|nr:SMF family protein [Dehalogenimonas lykanthroporepellens BL-DC-9]
MNTISENTQAILLLTAPLIVSRGAVPTNILTHTEYKKLATCLMTLEKEPADLLGEKSEELLDALTGLFDKSRLGSLLERGFLLSQATDYWAARGIWVISRADQEYPSRFKAKLKDNSPAILYGCGDPSILEGGGLAVVGSRKVDEQLRDYAQKVGRLAAAGNIGIVSGGARGIDRASMRGALECEGRAVGVLADSLTKASVERENRQFFIDERLVLITPFNPSAGFNVGNAMNRNKLIYALADAALVVNSDYKTGGTWAGAYEQLKKLKYARVFVRNSKGESKGLEELSKLGAEEWPEPEDKYDLQNILMNSPQKEQPVQPEMPMIAEDQAIPEVAIITDEPKSNQNNPEPDEEVVTEDLGTRILKALKKDPTPTTPTSLIKTLGVKNTEINSCLKALLKEGKVQKLTNPVRYTIMPPKMI